jgi:hypothetical protein
LGFRNDDSPEYAQIADCGEPKPIHYEVDRAAKQNEAGREKDERNHEREKGASPPRAPADQERHISCPAGFAHAYSAALSSLRLRRSAWQSEISHRGGVNVLTCIN